MSRGDVIDSKGGGSNGSGTSASLNPVGDQKLESNLWQEAMEKVKYIPPAKWQIDTSDSKKVVENIQQEAQARAKESNENHSGFHLTGGKKITYRKVWDKIVSYSKDFQVVGNILIQADPGYAALPWALVGFAITTFGSESETYCMMLEGVDFVSRIITQYTVIERLYAREGSELSASLLAKAESKLSHELRESLVSLYVNVLNYQIEALDYFALKKWSRTITGMNPVSGASRQNTRNAVDSAMKDVDRLAALIHQHASMHGIDELLIGKDELKDGLVSLAKETGNAFKEQEILLKEILKETTQKWQKTVLDLASQLQEEREIDQLLNVRTWVSATQPEEVRKQAKDKRPLPLGNWLLVHPKFKRWRSSPESSLLWMHGFAGTGKTGLALRVIDSFRSEPKDTLTPSHLAFFFCSNDTTGTGSGDNCSRADPEEALRSIVSQLSTTKEGRSIAPTLYQKYSEIGPKSDQERKLDYSDCVEIIVAISSNARVTIVLDAFDECDQGRSSILVEHLKDLIRQSPNNVRVFIFTRCFAAIEKELSTELSIEVTSENNGDDVREFISTTIGKRIDGRKLLKGVVSDDLKAFIMKTLTDRADNMFLYASLLMDQLCDQSRHDDEDSIRKKLNQLPKDLTEIYNHVMKDIHDENNNSERSCQIAQNTFKWLLHAQKTLQSDEFLEAISPTKGKASKYEVIQACRSLVVGEQNRFRFAHYSVREHLRKIPEYSPTQCHIVATQSCLTILNTTFGADHSKGDLSDAQRSFNRYALLYWPVHYEGIQSEYTDHRWEAIKILLRNFLLQGRVKSNKFTDWFSQAQEMIKESKELEFLLLKLNSIQANPPTPLFAACVFGIADLIGKFEREPNGLNKYNAHGQSALCLAVENNNLEVVKALLTRRFPADKNLLNVEAVDQFEQFEPKSPPFPKPPPSTILYATALQAAAANGAVEIAEYLIKEGAHINLVAGFYGSALQAAALRGHEAILSLLLRHGAEPNSQGGYHGNALQAAAASGHANIINLLLENQPPALVSTPGGCYGSALIAAIFSRNSDSVWTLLEERAQPNAKDKIHGYPLVMATTMGQGHQEIVSLLLEKGATADLTHQDNSLHLLHQAAMYGWKDLAEHCLQSGKCDIDMTTTEGPKYHIWLGDVLEETTPLAFACAEGKEEIVRFLLSKNAAIKFPREDSSALWAAAYSGHATIVDLIVKAFKARHDEAETQRFINQPCHAGQASALWLAAMSGSVDAVIRLLDLKADFKGDSFNITPFLIAATCDRPKVIELLFRYHREGKINGNLSIDERDNNGKTAIFEACTRNFQDTVKVLLDLGADYSISDNGESTPLHAANRGDRDNIALITMLVKHASNNLNTSKFQDFLDHKNSFGGKTVLMAAAERNRSCVIKLLLNHGADYSILDNSDFTALHYCAFRGQEAAVRTLLEMTSIHTTTNNGERFKKFLNQQGKGNKASALIDASSRGHTDVAKLLILHGAAYDCYDAWGHSPLHQAVINGHHDVCRLILEQAVKDKDGDEARFWRFLNAPSIFNKTALVEADDRNIPVMGWLKEFGA